MTEPITNNEDGGDAAVGRLIRDLEKGMFVRTKNAPRSTPSIVCTVAPSLHWTTWVASGKGNRFGGFSENCPRRENLMIEAGIVLQAKN